MSGTNIALLGDGMLLGFPVSVSLQKASDGLSFAGVLRLEDAGLHTLLDYTGSGLAKQIGSHVRDMLGSVSGDVAVRYGKGIKSLAYTGDVLFAAIGTSGGSAVLFRYVYKPETPQSHLTKAIEGAAKALGVKEFFLFFRTGGTVTVSTAAQLLPGSPMQDVDELKKLSRYDIVVRGHFDMRRSDSVFTSFMKTLFKLETLDLFIGAGLDGKNFETFLLLPSFDSGIVSGRELTVGCGLQSGTPSFSMSGTFVFSFLPGMTFSVDCSLGATAIRLTAFAKTDKPIEFLGPFKIGDTALLIGYENGGLTFGLLTTLYIGNLALFGGVIIKYIPPAAVEPLLVVVAIHELSLPLLVRNLCQIDFSGLDFFDFIQILGFELDIAKTFPLSVIRNADIPALIQHFNANVAATDLKLEAGRVETQRYGNGLAFIDQKRMRCYYIEKDGRLKLQAQVYFSSVPAPVQMGPYTVSGGIFLCGVIQIFSVKIKVLFSFVKGDGVLAFAQVDPIQIGGFLSLTASKQTASAGSPPFTMPKSSVMEQFMDKKSADGLLFFLQANKQDKFFYFSGCLKLFSLFEVDALLKYESGDILINVSLDIFIFTATLSLRVKYNDFQSGGFWFNFVLDTSKLEKALKKVSQSIEGAIAKVQKKVDGALRTLKDAQNEVWQLQSQIDSKNREIQSCRNAIKRSRWYQFWVRAANYAHIAYCEAAKLVLKASIITACTALEIAKAFVKIGGTMAEGVLHLVNGVVKAITSVFFIRRIELEAHAGTQNGKFKAAIAFVALGKEYSYSAEFAMGSFGGDALSDNMNAAIKPDLDALEKESFKSNFDKFPEEELYLPDHVDTVTQCMEQIRSAHNLINASYDAYFEEYQELPVSFEETNMSLLSALNDVQASFETIRRFQTQDALKEMVSMLHQNPETRSRAPDELKTLDEKLRQLDMIHTATMDAMPELDVLIDQLHQTMKSKQEEAALAHCGNLTACQTPDGNMLNVLDKFEAALDTNFPYRRAHVTQYMNLSREPSVWQWLLEARENYGGDSSQSRAAQMFARTSIRTDYEPRL